MAEEEKPPAKEPASPAPPPDKLREWGLAIVIMTFLALVLISFVMFIKGKI